jgi:nicotinate-nucleotide pyrophosphorylase (carboxylating)
MTMRPPIAVPDDLPAQVERALAEDIGSGDVTAALIPDAVIGRASVITREAAVICGTPYVNETFARLDARVQIDWQVGEGDWATAGQTLCTLRGPARALLTGERTALNFLQLLSATATAALAYTQRVAGTACQVQDTRKTLPGLRSAQKYAVHVGGARNHRIGLYDMVLIKENHIMAAGSIARAVAGARAAGAGLPVEVEVENLDELREAIAAGADIAMLDEFALSTLREAVQINQSAGRPLKLEASGGVTLQNIRDIALTGVDFVSVGGITKHVHAVDLSMRFAWEERG